MVKATRYFYINKNILLKPFIFLGFVFVENKTSKYILENPQSKLPTIREMDNSMIPIISPTSPKEGSKIVFINKNERPHNKYRIESEFFFV